jgi:hypothetical protein
MKIPSTNCPNCNSVQRFYPRDKIEGETIVKFICCLMCKEEFVIDEYPRNQKNNRKKATIIRNRNIRSNLRFNA